MVTCRSLVQMAQIFDSEQFGLIKAEPYGPPGGYQLFWSKGNVLARFKTIGEARGPRANRPHLSLGFNLTMAGAWTFRMTPTSTTHPQRYWPR